MNNGIYIHIPFCRAKCAYCDFNSYAHKEDLIDPYVERLLREMNVKRGFCADTVYIGGGTPTVLSDSNLERILYGVFKYFKIAPDAEITVEANPATVDKERFLRFKGLGINRVSIGVQSFSDTELCALSRIHTAREASMAIEDAHAAGIDNISLDLMYGIPNQTLETFRNSLETATALSPTHISAYSLILEEGTPLYKKNPVLPDEDTERAMHKLAIELLAQHGYEHYEISNFARPGFMSRHNTKYWTGAEYEGLGAGAHSYISRMRCENEPDILRYIEAADPVVSRTAISDYEAEQERFMLGFRMTGGFDPKGSFKKTLQKLSDMGLIQIRPDNVRLTERGLDLANLVFMEFVGETE